jgi:AraC-like DNA-binding protein
MFFRSRLIIDRDLHVQAVERGGMVFDTRFVPALPEPARDVDVLWLVARGRVLATRDGHPLDGATWHEAPCALRLTEAEFTGADGRRTLELAASGQPFRAVELRFRRAHAGAALPPTAAYLEPGPEVWLAVEGLLARIPHGDADGERATRALLRALAARELVRPSLEGSLTPDEPASLRAIWMMVSLAYSKLRTSSTLKELAGVALSTRRAERLLQHLAEQRLLQFTGWRSGLIQLRLGLASLLLSAPDFTVKRVAQEVGYANAEALANAFQRAGLPSPTEVRAGHRQRAATAPTVSA